MVTTNKFFLACIIIHIIFATGCATTYEHPRLYSLCTLDPDAKMCWIDKKKNYGISFDEMKVQNAGCEAGHGPPVGACWFGMTNQDLSRIIRDMQELDRLQKED